MDMEPKVFLSGKTRPGRGFSYSELKMANIDIRIAKNLGLRVDKRRKTAYEDNIKLLGEKIETEKTKREKQAKKKSKKGKAGKIKKTATKTPSKGKNEKKTGTVKK